MNAPLVLYGAQTRELLGGFMPSLWERWRRERQRRMLRSVEALGKDKCPARSDQWASATPLGNRVLDSLELLATVIYGLTLYAVSFIPAILANYGISFDDPNLDLNAPRHVQQRPA